MNTSVQRDDMNKELFLYVEGVFRDFVNELYENNPKSKVDDINVCCQENEVVYLMNMATYLKKEYPDMSLKDIYFVVIYTYYSLTLAEQTIDPFRLELFKSYIDDYNAVKNLYFRITTGSIKTNYDGKELDLASLIRKNMLFGTYLGGKKKRNKKRYSARTRTRRHKKTGKKNRRKERKSRKVRV